MCHYTEISSRCPAFKKHLTEIQYFGILKIQVDKRNDNANSKRDGQGWSQGTFFTF